MNKLTPTLLAAVCAGVLFIGAPQDTNAGHPLTRGFSGYGGCADGLSLYRSSHIPVPPYFSLHPPVYYSAPVARSYGYSPFPYPGDVRTPEASLAVVKPAIIDNPYASPVKEKKKTQPSEDSVAEASPEMVRNPYVDAMPHDSELHVAKAVAE